jgi:hypothetical protein
VTLPHCTLGTSGRSGCPYLGCKTIVGGDHSSAFASVVGRLKTMAGGPPRTPSPASFWRSHYSMIARKQVHRVRVAAIQSPQPIDSPHNRIVRLLLIPSRSRFADVNTCTAVFLVVQGLVATSLPVFASPDGQASATHSTRAPVIVDVTPRSGPVGTVVVIRGSNFSYSENVVQFRGDKDFAAGSPVRSADGRTLRFRVSPCPSRAPQCPSFAVPAGIYQVTVATKLGRSNIATFLLTRSGESVQSPGF